MIPTSQLLVFARKCILLFAGLVEFVVESLEFGLLVAQVALGLVVQLDGFVQSRLQIDVDPLQLFNALLQLPGCVVGLLQINNQNLDLGLQPGLLLLQVVHLDQQALDVLLLFGDPGVELAAQLLDFFDAGLGLGLVLGLPDLNVSLGLHELALEVQARFALLLQLDADRFQLDFHLVEVGFQQRAFAFVLLGAAAGIFELSGKLALQVNGVL